MSATLTIRIDDDMKERLEMLASSLARSKSYIVTHAIEDYLAVNEWQVREIKEGIMEAGEGRLMDHETILNKWESRLEDSMD